MDSMCSGVLASVGLDDCDAIVLIGHKSVLSTA